MPNDNFDAITLLDGEQLEMLCGDGGPEAAELLEELKELFQGENREIVAEMKTALAAGDSQTLTRKAHGLAGSSSNIGLLKLSKISKEIEISAKSGDLALCRQYIELMEVCLIQSMEVLSDYIRKL